MTADTQTEALLLSPEDVADLLDIGRSTLYRLSSAGKVPRPVKVGRSTKWRRREIEAWIAAGCPPRNRWEWEGSEQ